MAMVESPMAMMYNQAYENPGAIKLYLSSYETRHSADDPRCVRIHAEIVAIGDGDPRAAMMRAFNTTSQQRDSEMDSLRQTISDLQQLLSRADLERQSLQEELKYWKDTPLKRAVPAPRAVKEV